MFLIYGWASNRLGLSWRGTTHPKKFSNIPRPELCILYLTWLPLHKLHQHILNSRPRSLQWWLFWVIIIIADWFRSYYFLIHKASLTYTLLICPIFMAQPPLSCCKYIFWNEFSTVEFENKYKFLLSYNGKN